MISIKREREDSEDDSNETRSPEFSKATQSGGGVDSFCEVPTKRRIKEEVADECFLDTNSNPRSPSQVLWDFCNEHNLPMPVFETIPIGEGSDLKYISKVTVRIKITLYISTVLN
jgi:hypothetical protein